MLQPKDMDWLDEYQKKKKKKKIPSEIHLRPNDKY